MVASWATAESALAKMLIMSAIRMVTLRAPCKKKNEPQRTQFDFRTFKAMKRQFQNKRSLSDNARLQHQSIEQGGSRVSCTVVSRFAATAVVPDDRPELRQLAHASGRLGLRPPPHDHRHDPGRRRGGRGQASLGVPPALG